MNDICGIIDAQGFVNGGRFIVREFGIKTSNIDMCLDVETKLFRNSTNIADARANYYSSMYNHGLTIRPIRGISWHTVKDLLRNISNGKPFGIKNNQFGDLLHHDGISYIELHDAPLLERLGHCDKHTTPGSCAYVNCLTLYKWLEGKKNEENQLNLFSRLEIKD